MANKETPLITRRRLLTGVGAAGLGGLGLGLAACTNEQPQQPQFEVTPFSSVEIARGVDDLRVTAGAKIQDIAQHNSSSVIREQGPQTQELQVSGTNGDATIFLYVRRSTQDALLPIYVSVQVDRGTAAVNTSRYACTMSFGPDTGFRMEERAVGKNPAFPASVDDTVDGRFTSDGNAATGILKDKTGEQKPLTRGVLQSMTNRLGAVLTAIQSGKILPPR